MILFAKPELFLIHVFALTSLVKSFSMVLGSKGDSKHSLALSERLFGFNCKKLASREELPCQWIIYQFLIGVLNSIKSYVF